MNLCPISIWKSWKLIDPSTNMEILLISQVDPTLPKNPCKHTLTLALLSSCCYLYSCYSMPISRMWNTESGLESGISFFFVMWNPESGGSYCKPLPQKPSSNLRSIGCLLPVFSTTEFHIRMPRGNSGMFFCKIFHRGFPNLKIKKIHALLILYICHPEPKKQVEHLKSFLTQFFRDFPESQVVKIRGVCVINPKKNGSHQPADPQTPRLQLVFLQQRPQPFFHMSHSHHGNTLKLPGMDHSQKFVK